MQGRGQGRRAAIAARRGVCGLTAALALGVCGCSAPARDAPATPSAAKASGLRAVAPPAASTPEGVAVLALREIYTWHPAQEKPGDSFGRARQWLGPALIRVADGAGPAVPAPSTVAVPLTTLPAGPPPAIATPDPALPGTPPPSLRWNEWAAAGAMVEAFAFASGEVPADTDPGRVLRKIGIEQTVVYRDRREQLPSTTVIATIVKTDAGWRLDSYQ